jgi:CRISPR-associated endonuclease/helicase Cas3
MDKYKEFFKSLSGFQPYNFQLGCYKNIRQNKSLILQAPTGSGKTLASILPFVYNWMEWKKGNQTIEQFPRKLIYSLPLRTLANSINQEINSIIEKLDFNEKPIVTLQTGEYSEDFFFEGDIIFTTIDQTLSNVLSIPLSLPTKLSNINAGAVLSSYLVFDEFHLLEPQKSLSTTLMILKKLKNITLFCLMTATLTDSFITNISNFLRCEMVRVEETDYEKFSFIRNYQKRILNVRDKLIETSDIFELHKNTNKTIIICNTVKSCSEKTKAILNHIENQNLETELICLHSRFFQKHRKEKEKKILEYFGKNSEKENVILITTQIIEVGLDISCDLMLTEVSPINSFLQRIGRSARWGGESQIYVFHPQKEYVYNKELTESTFQVLIANELVEIDRGLAQQLITNVLTNTENSIFQMIKESSQITWEKITQSWQSGNKGFARELIRDIHSINIVLINKGHEISNLYNFESVSMHPFSLKGQLKKILNDFEGESPNLALTLQPSRFVSFDEEDEELVLTPISIDDIEYENIVALNANYIGYSELIGLDFEDNYGIVSDKIENKKNKFNIKYQYDTFKEHNNWMIEIFQEKYDYQYPLSKIQQKHYQEFDFEQLIKFMIICHDYGKLNNKWQEIVQEYQSLKSGSKVTELLAHTDFDKENESDVQMMKSVYKKVGLFKKPDHSGIGAYFVKYAMPYLFNLKKDKMNKFLVDVLISSVIRHHAAFADSAPKFYIEPKSYDEFLFYLHKSIPNLDEIKYPKEKLIQSKISSNDFSISFQQSDIAFLYFILVRILRLCDQKSFCKNPRKED